MHSRVGSRLTRGSVIATVLLGSLALSAPASAAIFTVDVTHDGRDANLNDAECEIQPSVIGTASFGGLKGCTLRAAIQEANHTAGTDAIHFNIPGSGVKTIAPNEQLPPLKDKVTIDGYTQPGTSPNTRAIANGDNAVLLIELSGANAGTSASGLEVAGEFEGSGSVIRGLVINRFSVVGIEFSAATGTVEGNFIGTDPSGTIDRGNGSDGIFVVAPPPATVIGGSSRGARNVISGNGRAGITAANQVTVQGNHIGTTRGGDKPLPNDADGLSLFASKNLVGGTGDAANAIAYNRSDGIELFNNTTGSRFTRNRISLNREQAIDLKDDGPTRNDTCDVDTGPNNLQNFPAINSAVTSSGRTTVAGTFRSAPNATFTLEFFRNPPGEGEAQRFIGAANVTTNANCQASFSLRTSTVAIGDNITATAIDSQGSTSEVSSSARKVTAPPPVLEQ